MATEEAEEPSSVQGQFEKLPAEVKRAVHFGWIPMFRVRDGAPDAARYVLYVGSAEHFVNGHGERIDDPVSYSVDDLAVDDIVEFSVEALGAARYELD